MAEALDQAIKAASINIAYANPGASGIMQRGIEHTPTSPLYPCPNCQRPNSAEMRYCTGCRYLLNRCPVCHFENRIRDRFCTRCGQPLNALRLNR